MILEGTQTLFQSFKHRQGRRSRSMFRAQHCNGFTLPGNVLLCFGDAPISPG